MSFQWWIRSNIGNGKASPIFLLLSALPAVVAPHRRRVTPWAFATTVQRRLIVVERCLEQRTIQSTWTKRTKRKYPSLIRRRVSGTVGARRGPTVEFCSAYIDAGGSRARCSVLLWNGFTVRVRSQWRNRRCRRIVILQATSSQENSFLYTYFTIIIIEKIKTH